MWREVWGSVRERCGRVYRVTVKGMGKCVGDGVWGKVRGSVLGCGGEVRFIFYLVYYIKSARTNCSPR